MTLSIAQTIKYNASEGIKIALAPLITDLPIAVISILVISRLPNKEICLGIIFLIGSIFITRLGIKGIKSKPIEINENLESPNSLKKGIVANFLNPNVYIFWFTIGSVAVVESWSINPLSSILYVTGFYTLLIGSRVILSLIVSKTKAFKHPAVYLVSMKILGSVLILFAVYYAYQGLIKLISV